MPERKIAGLTIKSEISIGNLFTFLTMIVLGVLAYANMQNQVNNNTTAIEAGILPNAQTRVTVLENQYDVIQRQLDELKSELRLVRAALQRTEALQNRDGG